MINIRIYWETITVSLVFEVLTASFLPSEQDVPDSLVDFLFQAWVQSFLQEAVLLFSRKLYSEITIFMLKVMFPFLVCQGSREIAVAWASPCIEETQLPVLHVHPHICTTASVCVKTELSTQIWMNSGGVCLLLVFQYFQKIFQHKYALFLY